MACQNRRMKRPASVLGPVWTKSSTSMEPFVGDAAADMSPSRLVLFSVKDGGPAHGSMLRCRHRRVHHAAAQKREWEEAHVREHLREHACERASAMAPWRHGSPCL